MKKLNFKSPISSVVGWCVGGVGAFVLLVLGVKWAWNSFFAEVLGLHMLEWNQALALVFWIALVVLIVVGLKETGK